MDWQPIETAPKDGREVLFWNGQCIQVGYAWYWDNNGRPQIDWHTRDDQDIVPLPTHWMPLPDPPGSVKASLGAPTMDEMNDNTLRNKHGQSISMHGSGVCLSAIGEARCVLVLPPIPVAQDFRNGDGYCNFALYLEALKAWKEVSRELVAAFTGPTVSIGPPSDVGGVTHKGL